LYPRRWHPHAERRSVAQCATRVSLAIDCTHECVPVQAFEGRPLCRGGHGGQTACPPLATCIMPGLMCGTRYDVRRGSVAQYANGRKTNTATPMSGAVGTERTALCPFVGTCGGSLSPIKGVQSTGVLVTAPAPCIRCAMAVYVVTRNTPPHQFDAQHHDLWPLVGLRATPRPINSR
jgi:hypothetical protein